MKGKTAAGGGAICAIAVMITIVMGNGNVRTNQAGLELIGNAEGCRRDPYMCPAGCGLTGLAIPTELHRVFEKRPANRR